MWIIGIDEAGRGPIAGPVSVGVVVMPESLHNWSLFDGLKDSKKLTERARNVWYDKINNTPEIYYGHAFSSNLRIDEVGIMAATQEALHSALSDALQRSGATDITSVAFLDWGLSLPQNYTQLISKKGDELYPAIALASVIAKVTRDAFMLAESSQFPLHGFDTHKGYGTAHHYRALEKYGITQLHRKTFLRSFFEKTS
jgi:ribonuclease HII